MRVRSHGRRAVAARATALTLAAALWLAGCGEEPERIVSAQTGDGRFELTLEAHKNWLKPGETLAVRVTVTSLQGQLAQSLRDTVTFVANAGSVAPNRLVFTFVGRGDSLYGSDGVTTNYTDWVTFAMSALSSQANPARQGEVIALFQDLEAILKIRVAQD